MLNFEKYPVLFELKKNNIDREDGILERESENFLSAQKVSTITPEK